MAGWTLGAGGITGIYTTNKGGAYALTNQDNVIMLPIAASQGYVTGNFVYLDAAGRVTIAHIASTAPSYIDGQIYGIAMSDAYVEGTTTSRTIDTLVPILKIRADTLIELPSSSATAFAAPTAAMVGVAGAICAPVVPWCRSNSTGSMHCYATVVTTGTYFRPVRLSPKDALTTVGGRMIGTITDARIQ
jgi:hypothetical protein